MSTRLDKIEEYATEKAVNTKPRKSFFNSGYCSTCRHNHLLSPKCLGCDGISHYQPRDEKP